ncbi:MAG: DUF4143 domain-containing protein [Gammaproteobacteria bacterium]|jgi:predicted AAA+ superfamily ATPase
MKRDLLKELEKWSRHPLRKPLILRGARQVGKSWLIEELGKQFKNYMVLNFDKDKKACEIFRQDFRISTLVKNIELYTKNKVIPGETLLFLDEIQECEEAIAALRYFKEEMPDLHVVAAGSLIDFVLENIGMPVGRVQFMYLHPLSFGEFLNAVERNDLRQHIFGFAVSPVIHQEILQLLKTYLWLGGMPAVVSAWIQHKNVTLCQDLQEEIISAYNQDFHKYARDRQIAHVDKVFATVPTQLGCKFKYIRVDREIRSVFLKEALMLLEKAGVVHICFHSSGQTQPLAASKNDKKFKVYFLDVGLAQKLLGLDLSNWFMQPMQLKTLGPIAEQLVAQELIAYTNIKAKKELYYWHREEKNSNAEIDFLTIKGGQIIPVEVKAGPSGSLKSMHIFLESHKNSPYGLKIGENLFTKNNDLQEIPLYGIEAWLKH